MFGIGSTELLVILVVALVVLGPKSLASVSRTLGKAMGEFRRVSTDFQRTLNAEAAQEEEAERRQKVRDKAARTAEAAEAARAARRERLDAAPNAMQGREADAAQDRETAAAPTDDREKTTLQPPEGSPLADALAKSRAEAEAATAGATVSRETEPGANKGQNA